MSRLSMINTVTNNDRPGFPTRHRYNVTTGNLAEDLILSPRALPSWTWELFFASAPEIDDAA
jgi:hypothetical protein